MKHWLERKVDELFDNRIRLAVTGLSRSGKTAFITSFVHQLININTGAKLPFLAAAKEKRICGVKIIERSGLQPRFPYEEGIEQIYSVVPSWPVATTGLSEISLQIKYKRTGLLKHLSRTSTLRVDIIDYPGEWLIDLPMLEQSYLTWSQKMIALEVGERSQLAQEWKQLCAQLDPLAPFDENLITPIVQAYDDYLKQCKQHGYHFLQPGQFILQQEDNQQILPFFPWRNNERYEALTLDNAPKNSTYYVLNKRYHTYCNQVVRKFYTEHFQQFDRQILLVDCLQPLTIGKEAFEDMQHALTELMRSFSYGKRTLLRRLFDPCIDKLLFVASKADHVTTDQQVHLIELLRQLLKKSQQNTDFADVKISYMALASIRATQEGFFNKNRVLEGHQENGEPLIFYPGDVPKSLYQLDADFWQNQGFEFKNFRPPVLRRDQLFDHIRMDQALEFLLGDKLT